MGHSTRSVNCELYTNDTILIARMHTRTNDKIDQFLRSR